MFNKSNATTDKVKLDPTRKIWKVHNEIKSLGSSICGGLEMFCLTGLICEGWEEVLKFIQSGRGLPVNVEEDVGLGFHHRLFISQCHGTVVEMEPASLVGGVSCVMSRANPESIERWKHKPVTKTLLPVQSLKGYLKVVLCGRVTHSHKSPKLNKKVSLLNWSSPPQKEEKHIL